MKNPQTYNLDSKIRSIENISDNSLELLHNCIKQKNIDKEQFLLTEGSVCKKIYFVEKGLLRSFYNKDGKDVNLDFFLENSFTTHLKSLQSGQPSEYFLQAVEKTTVWEFDKEKVLQLYTKSAEVVSFGRKLLELLLAAQEEHTNLFKLYSGAERYQYLLQHKPQLFQRVSLTHLASFMGISRETLSRIRKN